MRRDRLTPVASPGERVHRATALAAVLMLLVAEGVAAQSPLQQAVELARLAWLQHDFSGLVESSDTVRLQFPEGGRAPSVRPAHAARVLEEYLVSANEIAFELRNIRQASDDHAYAQLVRRYVVRRTSDERVETVFLGFRRVDGRWLLREIRITP